jgi:diguanylate cyclase (GGDEF)-like protein
VAVAVFSCIGWFVADQAAGGHYSHPAIPVWNALIRLGFFVVTGLLLDALHRSLRAQQHLALTDALTGLAGRRALEERLGHDLALAQRRATALTLAYLDLDGFKAVNDAHGHAAGDRLLKAVGRLLQGAVRETDTAARIGGDEFALVLPDTDERGARQVVEKLARELGEIFAAHPGGAGCSIGVVTLLDAATSPQRALAAADALMYEVKRKGKGAVSFSVLGKPTTFADRIELTKAP